jgi:hypothetical protein
VVLEAEGRAVDDCEFEEDDVPVDVGDDDLADRSPEFEPEVVAISESSDCKVAMNCS